MNPALKIALPRAFAPVLGVGAFLKNTLCLIQGNEAWISPDNGSLDNVAAVERFEQAVEDMLIMAGEKPVAVAHDIHPDFASTRYAMKIGRRTFPVQHHHAHIASIMAEHGVDEPVLGLALDGFGLGERNEAWGGELLLVDGAGYKRLGHLLPLPQPGGDAAARQPWRMGAAALWALGRGDEIPSVYGEFPQSKTLAAMLDKGINCPQTSSAGRLFDAACGLLMVKPVAAYEGEAPVALESMVEKTKSDPKGWIVQEDGVLDMRPLLNNLVGVSAKKGAELFHGTLIDAIAAWAIFASDMTGVQKIAFGGGCFLNKVLKEGLCKKMAGANITVLLPERLPPGDAAISLGQAWAAAMVLDREK